MLVYHQKRETKSWAKTGNPFSRRRHFSRAVSKRERGWLIDRDIVASLHILLFSHMSPGFFWLKPKSGCFLFLSKGACFLFLYLSVFVHCLVCAYCTCSPSPLCISSVSGRRRVVCDWGQVGLCIAPRGGLSSWPCQKLFLSFYFTWFQFVSVSCWAPGWVGGVWGGRYGCEMPREGLTILWEEPEANCRQQTSSFLVDAQHTACDAFYQWFS